MPVWLGKLSQRLAVLRGRPELRPDREPPERPAISDVGAEPEGRAPDGEAPSSRPEGLRQLIEGNRELSRLYARHGYVPAMARQADHLVAELGALIRADIADFTVFQRALRAIGQQTAQAATSEFAAATPGGERPLQDGPNDLLRAVLDVLDDRQAIIALLNRDPVHQSLAFIECLPFYIDGKLTWRTPAWHALIRKRPTHRRRFAQLLDELEQLFHTAVLRRKQLSGQRVLDAIAAVRRSLHQDDAYLPTPLHVLERAVRECLQRPPTAQGQARLRQLDDVLGTLVSPSATQASGGHHGGSHHDGKSPAFREAILQRAQTYLNTAWMHTPWLTARLLTALLDAELAKLAAKPPADRSPVFSALQCIRDEVASGHYDRAETIRRLRLLESSKVYIHSLIYAVLRLGRRAISET